MDDLVSYRIENAREKLESSKILLDAGHYKDSIGRSYYSIFTGVCAVLAKDGIDFKKHAGVIAYFQKEYIKQENLIKSILNIYRQLFKLETTVITVIFLLCQEKMQKNNISMH